MKFLQAWRAWWAKIRRRITTPKWFINEMSMIRASQQRRDDIQGEIMQIEVELSKR